MDKEQAKRLIIDTFENSFDKNKFTVFLGNLLKSFEPKSFAYQANYIPNAYEKYISSLERIGKYICNDKEIDLLIVRLKRATSLERARTMQRNFIAWYLKGSRGGKLKDAALVAFVSSDNEDWRFSLVKMDYRFEETPSGKVKVEEEFTPARRWSFLVGKNEKSHTAQSRFVPILENDEWKPTLEDLEKAFDVEVVTKEFFEKISNWYFWALKNVKFPKGAESEPNGRNIALIRLLTRLIFIYFMKRKGLIPESLFDYSALKDIIKDLSPNESTYYKAILQNLFFATLSCRQEERKFADDPKWFGKGIGGSKDYGNQYVYRYKELFKISEKEVLNLFKEIPFLNGGLFEMLDDKENNIYIDGFTRIEKYQPVIPNFLFFSDEIEVDLSEDYKDSRYKKAKAQGLINILNIFNFTIEESMPIDVDVALDPELLGKVFENLLASYNPETATTARKATGSYYTPREIVDYMVDESLKEYFKTKLPNIDAEKLEQLFSYHSLKNLFDEETTNKLINAIHNLKIIDPAVGSGAFPMGILHKLVHILSKLDPHNEKWKEEQIKAVERNVTDPTLKKELIQRIEESFTQNELDYGRKLYLIQNCIYGVDIQSIAIQIAKLRFFISLLVDEKVDKTKTNCGIEPLPNLETKFVAANTLIGLEKPAQLALQSEIVNQLKKELKKVRDEYFITFDVKKKVKLKQKDTELRSELARGLKGGGFPSDTTEKIASWDPYDTNKSADWFDPEWMFGVKDGFDIVIANPPYVRQEKIKPLKPRLRSYKVFDSTADLYTYFFEKGYDLLKEEGIFCFISSNKWMRAKYGENLRKFLKENTKVL